MNLNPTALLCIGFLQLFASKTQAQSEHSQLMQADKAYQSADYKNAISLYEQILQTANQSVKAAHNSGNGYYKTQNYDKAIQAYEQASTNAQNPTQKAYAQYNLGNAHLQKKDYAKAVDAYKNALRQNPADLDAKNNLAYASRILQQEQEKQKKEQEEKDKNKPNPDEQKPKPDEEKPEPEQKDPNEGKENPQNQPQNQENPTQKQPDKPLDNVDKLMEIIENEDKNTQKKVQQQKAKRNPKNIEKDW